MYDTVTTVRLIKWSNRWTHTDQKGKGPNKPESERDGAKPVRSSAASTAPTSPPEPSCHLSPHAGSRPSTTWCLPTLPAPFLETPTLTSSPLCPHLPGTPAAASVLMTESAAPTSPPQGSLLRDPLSQVYPHRCPPAEQVPRGVRKT